MTLPLLGLMTLVAFAALVLAASNRRKVDALAARIATLEVRPVTPAPAERKPRQRASPSLRVDRGVSANLARPILITVPNLSTKSAGSPASSELEQRFASIWAMADAGRSAEAIAREMGQPIGQVELILALKHPRAATGGPRPS